MLERVRKKRRLSSGNNLADTTGASSRLSTFVQSALRHTPLEGPEMGQHENSSKRRSGSSNRKKRRLGMFIIMSIIYGHIIPNCTERYDISPSMLTN